MLTLITVSGLACTFNLKKRQLPLAVQQLLTTNSIMKVGYGASKGLHKLRLHKVLKSRARNVLDIDDYLQGDPEWHRPLEVFEAGGDLQKVADEKDWNRTPYRRSREFKTLRALDKFIYLASDEDVFSMEKDRQHFINAFFRCDNRDYVEGIERDGRARDHMLCHAHWGLHGAYLIFFEAITAEKNWKGGLTLDAFLKEFQRFCGVKQSRMFAHYYQGRDEVDC